MAAKVRKQLKKGRATAAALADARYRKRVVASAKVYRRKGPPAPQEDENE